MSYCIINWIVGNLHFKERTHKVTWVTKKREKKTGTQ